MKTLVINGTEVHEPVKGQKPEDGYQVADVPLPF